VIKVQMPIDRINARITETSSIAKWPGTYGLDSDGVGPMAAAFDAAAPASGERRHARGNGRNLSWVIREEHEH